MVANHLLKELANETRVNQALNKEIQQDDIEYNTNNDFYSIYDEKSSEINDFDDILPIDEQELSRYLEETFIPIIDDHIMTEENH